MWSLIPETMEQNTPGEQMHLLTSSAANSFNYELRSIGVLKKTWAMCSPTERSVEVSKTQGRWPAFLPFPSLHQSVSWRVVWT